MIIQSVSFLSSILKSASSGSTVSRALSVVGLDVVGSIRPPFSPCFFGLLAPSPSFAFTFPTACFTTGIRILAWAACRFALSGVAEYRLFLVAESVFLAAAIGVFMFDFLCLSSLSSPFFFLAQQHQIVEMVMQKLKIIKLRMKKINKSNKTNIAKPAESEEHSFVAAKPNTQIWKVHLISVPFHLSMFGLVATNECSSLSAIFAIFCLTISAIWCFCVKKKEQKKKPTEDDGEVEEERKTLI